MARPRLTSDLGTRERLLQVAEELYAARGVSNVSLREITRKARVNAAILHYHFGSKVGFYEAISERCLKPINDERIRLLEEYERKHGTLVVADIVRAWIFPTLTRQSKNHSPALLMRLYADIVVQADPSMQKATIMYSREAVSRFVRAFQRALPDIAPAEVGLRFFYLMGILRNICADPISMQQLSKGRCSLADVDGAIQHIVESLAAALSAPTSPSRAAPSRPRPARTRA